MNPFAAVEPIGAARGPLATLQALADALAGPAAQPVMGEVDAAVQIGRASWRERVLVAV